ncbi:MAG: SPASM domain-containing protein [Bacteroidales bacterium]|nr:SPASM domain-containing protein [Candidatus Egerieousia equi]
MTNSLLELDDDVYDILLQANQGEVQLSSESFDDDLYKALIDNGILVDSHKDELLIYKSIIHSMRAQESFMHLTIAPTTDCNFNCFYCFERNKQPLYMKESVMDSIVKYISSFPLLRTIKITWFGGEPLMANNEIRTLYSKLSSIPNIKIVNSDIVTTGFYLDDDAIQMLKEVNVRNAQITLDGNKQSHNKIKYDTSGVDVFDRVINNVHDLINKYPDFHITFRINLTKRNAAEYVDLHRFLISEFPGKNVGISPAFVADRNPNSKGRHSDSNIFFNNKESCDFVIELITKFGIPTTFTLYPDQQLCECAIRDKMAISFDPLGFAYKCWERIGSYKYAIGKLNDSGSLEAINQKELNRELYGADPLENTECCDCAYLPICHGGCPIKRIQNEYEGYDNELCTSKKGRIDQFLKIHLRLKELGYNNR